MTSHSTKKHSKTLWAILIATASMNTPVHAENTGKSILDQQCVSCHTLSLTTPQTVEQLWESKGPDLSSAGVKYKSEWMTNWLQKPVRIRPAGNFYANHIKTGEKSDVIDKATLVDHPKLSSNDAKLVVDELMTLKHNQQLVKQGDYQPGTISMTLGEMMFDKFKGCLACHQIEPGYGGLSGPEVYTAANRLQEDYLISFLRNPQAWEPKNIMPNKNLKEIDLQKLVHYLRALSKEDFK
ncbi:MAG TPA: cytochrome C [Crenotrichaceae bacterium]|nr:cytochrome C [Crenotrichaceae bacterium]